MADFLLIPDAGHGSWWWGRVWGQLTAPQQYPPRLYAQRKAGEIVTPDLPGHNSVEMNGSGPYTADDFIKAILDPVKDRELRDLIMVGHGLSAGYVLHAASMLETPPRRVILLAGLVPDHGKSVLDSLPQATRMMFKIMSRKPTGASKKEIKLARPVIDNIYCNGMTKFDSVLASGWYRTIPSAMLSARQQLGDLNFNFPISYVPLWRDRLVPSPLQQRMAQKLPRVEIERELDACHEVILERPEQVAEVLLKHA